MSVVIDHLRGSVWPLLEQAYDLPQGVLGSIASVETGGRFDARAVNPGSGAAGLFQLTPITLKQLQIDTGIAFDPFSPGAASAAAALLLRRHLRTFRGDVSLALAAYNAGEGRIKRFLREVQAQGTGKLPVETARYVQKVTGAL